MDQPRGTNRRHFLRRAALVVGAFVLGVGRSEPAFGSGGCNFPAGECSEAEINGECSFSLSWVVVRTGGSCVECYENAEKQAAAVASGEGCFYTDGIKCGYYIPPVSRPPGHGHDCPYFPIHV